MTGSDPKLGACDAPSPRSAVTHATLDRWAIVISGLCVIHCLAIPLTLIALPALSQGLADEQTLTHWLLLAIAVPISVWALWSGHRQHPSKLTLGLGVAGLLLLTLGVSHLLGHELEIPLTVAGGVGLIAAHWRNMRHRH